MSQDKDGASRRDAEAQRPDLNALCIEAAQAGRADELACGMLAMSITAALGFLRDELTLDSELPEAAQVKLVGDALLTKARAERFGELAAQKLCEGADPVTAKAFGDAVAAAVMASINLTLTSRACDGNPVAAAGMCAMGAQSLLKELGV